MGSSLQKIWHSCPNYVLCWSSRLYHLSVFVFWYLIFSRIVSSRVIIVCSTVRSRYCLAVISILSSSLYSMSYMSILPKYASLFGWNSLTLRLAWDRPFCDATLLNWAEAHIQYFSSPWRMLTVDKTNVPTAGSGSIKLFQNLSLLSQPKRE